jgi:hypothetical protein
VRQFVDVVESELGLVIARRLIDPNMGRSPASSDRGVTWQDEFDRVGLVTDLADDSTVGRTRVNEMLKPDASVRRPRMMVSSLCEKMIHQMTRYVWDDFKQSLERDQKQKPKEKFDDFPAILRYLANSEPSFDALVNGNRVIHRNDPRMARGAAMRRREVVRAPSVMR